MYFMVSVNGGISLPCQPFERQKLLRYIINLSVLDTLPDNRGILISAVLQLTVLIIEVFLFQYVIMQYMYIAMIRF